MKIRFEFDLEDGPIEPNDPLGEISITGSDGCGCIHELTFIDAWLTSLIEAVTRIRAGESSLDVDLCVEPHPLKVEATSDGIVLKYKDQQVVASSIDQMAEAVVGIAWVVKRELDAVAGEAIEDWWSELISEAEQLRKDHDSADGEV